MYHSNNLYKKIWRYKIKTRGITHQESQILLFMNLKILYEKFNSYFLSCETYIDIQISARNNHHLYPKNTMSNRYFLETG